jgi:hypothetical protein
MVRKKEKGKRNGKGDGDEMKESDLEEGRDKN